MKITQEECKVLIHTLSIPTVSMLLDSNSSNPSTVVAPHRWEELRPTQGQSCSPTPWPSISFSHLLHDRRPADWTVHMARGVVWHRGKEKDRSHRRRKKEDEEETLSQYQGHSTFHPILCVLCNYIWLKGVQVIKQITFNISWTIDECFLMDTDNVSFDSYVLCSFLHQCTHGWIICMHCFCSVIAPIDYVQ